MQQRHEHHRQPTGEDVLHVRQLREAERHEGVEDAGRDSCRRAAADHPPEEKRAEAGEGEAEEERDVVRGQRVDAERAQRKEQQRDAVEILAERQRVLRRIERVRIEEMQRLVQRRVPIPVEDPGVDVRVAGKGHRGAQVAHEGPGHQKREGDEQRCGGPSDEC